MNLKGAKIYVNVLQIWNLNKYFELKWAKLHRGPLGVWVNCKHTLFQFCVINS